MAFKPILNGVVAASMQTTWANNLSSTLALTATLVAASLMWIDNNLFS